MRTFKKAAVTMSAVGLLAFGAVAGTGGSALATTGTVSVTQSITGCSTVIGAVAAGLQPNCTASIGTIDNPTSITFTVNTTALDALLGAQPGQGLKAAWTLSCVVNGKTVRRPGTFTVTTATAAPSESTTIDLQTAVGSPAPNQCTISGLMVETVLVLTDASVSLSPFTIGIGASGLSALPGTIYQDEGTTGSGGQGAICADDANNGNAGSKIQSFQCVSDLADSYVRTSAGQVVHNGDCLSLSGSKVILAACGASNAYQQWSQSAVGGTLRNKGSNSCLTATSPKNGIQLQVKSCGSQADQKWHLPKLAA